MMIRLYELIELLYISKTLNIVVKHRWPWLFNVHQPFSLFLHPLFVEYVNLFAHLETQHLYIA